MSRHIKLDEGKKLLRSNFSVMVVDEKKTPLVRWTKLQKEPWTDVELEKNVQDKSNAWRYGLITGFGGLFCIDVDLKVFSNVNEREPFFEEFISFIRDNVDSFDKKVAIYKTANFGYHLVYRTKTTMGNQKLAKLKGHDQAVLETRGVGGYIVVYDECINEMDYSMIQELTEEEHEIIVNICRYYDEPKETAVSQPKKAPMSFKEGSQSPWSDYNERTQVMDIVGDEFEIVRSISSRYIVKRYGAKSAHSGYIYKDSGCLFLFTTGTAYPNETLLSPFALYTHKNHGGDWTSASRELYAQGYGDRQVQSSSVIEEEVEIDKSSLDFPIDIFPKGVQKYLVECNRTLDSSIDYMGVSMIWLMSVIIGNSMRIQVKSGWTEGVNIWVAAVGKAGLGKTPSIDNVIKPLVDVNTKEIREYQKQFRKFQEYEQLSDKEKKTAVEVSEPSKRQFIVNDVTIEALVELHEENPNAIGVFKDELAGWMKDMNKYRAGSDLEFWLSTWSGKPIALNRKTVKNTYVERPLIPVLGGIQPAILNELFTVENKENGFVDRMLLCFPDLQVEQYNENELDEELLQWYSDYISAMYSDVKNSILKYGEDMEIVPHIVKMGAEARKEWIRIFNDLTNVQNSEDENEYMKSMLPKQKSYIPRFALLLNALERYNNDEPILSPISKSAILNAEKLSKYFIAMAKKLKVDSLQVNKLRSVLRDMPKADEFTKYKAMMTLNPKTKKSEAADILNVSRQTLTRWDKKLEKN